MQAFNWQIESTIDHLSATSFKLSALPKSDYFVNPATKEVTANAAFYYKEVTGDFILQATVTPDFKGTYDAGCLFFMEDETHWGKLAFEKTDIDTEAVVSVVTKGQSDDANGVNIPDGTIHLQLARKGDLFGMHYSYDGVTYLMARYFGMDCPPTLKVGFLAQAPVGDGTTILFEHVQLLEETLKNLRSGERAPTK